MRQNNRARQAIIGCLIFLSPVFAAVIAYSAFRFSVLRAAPQIVRDVAPFFALATSPIAALGPVAGMLLVRGSLVLRVVAGIVGGATGFVAYWIFLDLLHD